MAGGPDVERHLQVAQPFIDAGFDHIVTQNAGPDPDGFMNFYATELAAPLRALTPADNAGPSITDRVVGAMREVT